ncbi:hypothetical protein [Neisseria weixii]|nr:hypothetical protein [Neisseria weixii]
MEAALLLGYCFGITSLFYYFITFAILAFSKSAENEFITAMT